MKICLIHSSTNGIETPNEKFNKFPDPNWYISKSYHEFFIRYVTKANFQQDIDHIYEEGKQKGWDMYLNFMWGAKKDNVAGVEATKYLESKNMIILTSPSRFLEKTKVDLYNALTKEGNLQVPQNTPNKYPKIVKYADGYGELNLDAKSVCYTAEDITQRVSFMREECPHLNVLVQDYIIGIECSVIVIEMGQEVVALTPLQHVFPGQTPENETFLSWEGRFQNAQEGKVKYNFVEDGPNYSLLREIAIKTFKILGVTSGGGWARVDMRMEFSTGIIYVIDVNPTPFIFYPLGNVLGDDLVVGQRFPGGHQAFLDTLIATKQTQMGIYKQRNAFLAGIYDANGDHYQSLIKQSNINYFKFQAILVSKFEFSGSILEMACGTGYFGEQIYNNCIKAEVTGIEISTGMLKSPAIENYYKHPILVGPMQDLIMVSQEYDHIVCFGALHFLDSAQFSSSLARMFMLARKSLTFEIDDLSSKYIASVKERFGEHCFNANHVQTTRAFCTPHGWSKIYEGKHEVFKSLTSGEEIWGLWYRFERTSFLTDGGGDLWLMQGRIV